MTLDRLIADARARMATAGYSPAETAWMVRDMLAALKGWTRADMLLRGPDEASDYVVEKITEWAARVAAGEPVQYVTGETRFHGLRIITDKRALIPRPETEQLVDLAADAAADRPDLRVLDAGTGSGCIAVALARQLRFPTIDAIDISPDALALAAENARALRVNVNFSRADMLTMKPQGRVYDIIISNPPYIAGSESAAMSPTVLLHEPHSALFVPDDDPLLFYRALARYAFAGLRHGGSLWLEINPLFAAQTRACIADAGLARAQLHRDERGKERFLSAVCP